MNRVAFFKNTILEVLSISYNLMMKLKIKPSILLILPGLALFSTCQTGPKPESKSTDPAFINKPFWLSSPFLEAVAADSDTIGWSSCMELHFRFKDSVLVVNCESDAMLCAYRVIDETTIEITSGFGDEAKPLITQVGEDEVELSGIFDNQSVRFKPINHPDRDPRGLSIRYLAEHLAGTYTSKSNGATSVVLTGDGKVKGFGEYDKFAAAIGPALATDQGNMLYFYSDQGELPLVWQKRGDTLTLWKLKNVSAPDEVPWYELDGAYDVWVRKR